MPLLWFRIASDGTAPARFTLQVPFQFGRNQSLALADCNELEVGKVKLEIIENQGFHLLRICGFESSEQADEYFPRLQGALSRLVVRKKLSVKFARGMQRVKLHESPVDVRGNPNFGLMFEEKGWSHLDGYVNHSPAVVIPEHLRIMEFGTGAAQLTVGMPVPLLLQNLAEDLALPKPEGIASDERLSLAIDLYSASLWEESQSAQVVSLATCLEALLTRNRVTETAMIKIGRLMEVFDAERNVSSENDEHRNEFDRLRARLDGLREESVSENLRNLAARYADVIGETAVDARRNIVSAYATRSQLVHNGRSSPAKIEEALSWLGKAVPAILEAMTIEVSKGQ